MIVCGPWVTGMSLSGGVLWQREIASQPGQSGIRQSRIDGRGMAWVGVNSPDGPEFHEVGADGSMVRAITLSDQQPGESVGSYVALPDGMCVAWNPPRLENGAESGPPPRIACYDGDGSLVWSTDLGIDAWVPAPFGRRPGHVEVAWTDPILVSGDRVLVSTWDPASGIAVSYFVDLGSGGVIASTAPGPQGYQAIAGPGEFLVGLGGYGVTSTTRYDCAGNAVLSWPSYGLMVIDRHGSIRGPEMEGTQPSRDLFRGLNPDGSLRDGPHLSGYYTAYPAVDSDGTIVFWRDGRLRAVGADFVMGDLAQTPGHDRSTYSRVLLLDGGLVVMVLDEEVLFFEDTALRQLGAGPWPCGDGNLGGNPVAFVAVPVADLGRRAGGDVRDRG
jgi:hypothetical protein